MESLTDLLQLDTYETFVDKASELSAMWTDFEEEETDDAVVEALEGFTHQAVITLHANNFQEIEKHFDAGSSCFVVRGPA